jgi:hypothetical protein
MKVHIIQLLCPQRHAIFAIAYEHPDLSDEDGMKSAETTWKLMIESGFNPWCALCDSRELKFEIGVSKFATMKEAFPHLKQTEIDNMLTRMRLLAERN